MESKGFPLLRVYTDILPLKTGSDRNRVRNRSCPADDLYTMAYAIVISANIRDAVVYQSQIKPRP